MALRNIQSPDKPLNPRQQKFVVEYLKDFNGTRAAIAAGFSKRSAGAISSELLKKPNVIKLIAEETKLMLKNERDILSAQIVNECKKIAFSDITNFVEYDANGNLILMPSKDVDGSVLESIDINENISESGVTRKKKIKLYDKIKALDILARYTELYKEQTPNNITNIIYLDKQDENL